MSGKVENVTDENIQTYEKNIKYAASLLASHNIVGLIEPINNQTVPYYFMNSYEKGMSSRLRIYIKYDGLHVQYLKSHLIISS